MVSMHFARSDSLSIAREGEKEQFHAVQGVEWHGHSPDRVTCVALQLP